jgi:hypothetical protein
MGQIRAMLDATPPDWDVVMHYLARRVSLKRTAISVQTPNACSVQHTHLDHAIRELQHAELLNQVSTAQTPGNASALLVSDEIPRLSAVLTVMVFAPLAIPYRP